jgi:hypothetical protein
MWRQTEGMLERAPEVKTGELRDLRKTLQRDYLVEVRLDELSEFLLLPACKATGAAGFVVDYHDILPPDCMGSISRGIRQANAVWHKERFSTPLL